MSYYESTQRFLKSSKAQRAALDLDAHIVLLAIAREADRINSPTASIEATDELIYELVNKECQIQCKILCKKILIKLGEKEISNDMIERYLYMFVTTLDENEDKESSAYAKLHAHYAQLKSMSQKRVRAMVNEMKEFLKANPELLT